MDEDIKRIYQMIVPTQEEIANVIKKLNNAEKLTFDDIVVIGKIRWIKCILDSRNERI